jgi:hypothetical protein
MINTDIFALSIDIFNKSLDKFIPVICILAVAIVILRYTRKRIQKDGISKGIYFGVLACVEVVLPILFIGYVPIWLSNATNSFFSPVTIRWALILLVPGLYVRSTARKSTEKRGLYFLLILLGTILLGWLYDRWVGILFITLPVLLIFYHVIYKVAHVILPSANPEDKSEQRRKASAFLMYLLGIQYPFWVASKKASRGFDERIPGNPTNDYGKPGVVWTWPHQVVGLSRGIQFNKVDGPGTVYTDMYESPVALIDLRTHLRTTVVDAVTRDGMQVPAVVFMAFAIDRDKWPKEGWSKAHFSRMKYLFNGDAALDHLEGSYPFSSGRVRAAINKIGVNTCRDDGDRPEFCWDEWIVKQVEQATREVVSKRSLDELWRPIDDGPAISALDEMAADLREQLTSALAEIGVQLYGARIVNYEFKDENPITKQNIKTWSTFWEQQITEAHADAEAIYREEIERAHAFSKSVLLDAIAESINAARAIDPKLPRHVIAQYYVHALEEYIKTQPGVNTAESRKRVEDLRGLLMYRTEGNE